MAHRAVLTSQTQHSTSPAVALTDGVRPEYDYSGLDGLFANDNLTCGLEFLNGPTSHRATTPTASEVFDFGGYNAIMEGQMEGQMEEQNEQQAEHLS